MNKLADGAGSVAEKYRVNFWKIMREQSRKYSMNVKEPQTSAPFYALIINGKYFCRISFFWHDKTFVSPTQNTLVISFGKRSDNGSLNVPVLSFRETSAPQGSHLGYEFGVYVGYFRHSEYYRQAILQES